MGTTQYLDGRGQAFRQVVTAPAGAERNATLLMADEDVNVFAVQVCIYVHVFIYI